MTIPRVATVILMVGLVSSCSTLPHCYSTSAADAAKTSTKSCPAWMCNLDGRNTECVTNTGGGEVRAPISSRRSSTFEEPEAQPSQEIIVRSEPGTEPDPVVRLEADDPLETGLPAMDPEPDDVMPTQLDEAPVGNFALQVAAMSSEISATKFIADLYLDDAQIIAVESNGATFYAVVNGYFASREEGVVAADAFRASYGGSTPWVRRVEEMRESRERLNE